MAISALFRLAKSKQERISGEPAHANEEKLMALFKQDLPVIVDFWAVWCGPRRSMNGVLSKFAKAQASRLILAKIDTTLHPGLTRTYRISGLPTILLFQRGEEAGRHVGPMSLNQLRKFVQQQSED